METPDRFTGATPSMLGLLACMVAALVVWGIQLKSM
jgi:hypothetical protein